jgi:hypothetical protein
MENVLIFMCRHVTAANVHTFLVIDRSGSMAAASVTPDNHVIPSHRQFSRLDNVLGVVYEAAYKYMSERASRAPQDLLTFIPFNHCSAVGMAAQPVTDVDALLNGMMVYKPEGGTFFGGALSCAQNAMQAVCISTCFPNFVRSAGGFWARCSGSSVSLGMLTLY